LDEIRDVEVGDAYLRLELDEPLRIGLLEDVRELFPEAVEIRLLRSSPSGRTQSTTRIGRPPQDLFADYLTSRSIDDSRLNGLFKELLAEAQELDA
jgi:exonuclease SbcD